MRSEQEMLDLIIGVAEADERIRAALLVGSRANPEAPKDPYQDYDVGYIVNDMAPFYDNTAWVEAHFGKPAIMQLPEKMTLLPPDGDGHFTWLMLFDDGNRVDLSVNTGPGLDDGEPAVVLLDKDGLLAALPPPSPAFWHIKPPTEKLYADCCNEFWWCLNNVAKGIARDELPYALQMYNVYVREMLDKMVEWYIGAQSGFAVSAGKGGKYFKNHLPPQVYSQYLATYPVAEARAIWQAVYTACGLFHTLAQGVAAKCGYTYNQAEEDGAMGYLNRVRHGGL